MKLRFSRKARLALLILGVALVGAVAVTNLLKPQQPVYDGLTVEEWLKDFCRSDPDATQGRDHNAAFKKMGRDAVPVEIHFMIRPDTTWEKRYGWLHSKSPRFIQKRLPAPIDSASRHFGAWYALIENQHIHDFFPEFVRLLSHNDALVRESAARLISWNVKPSDEYLVPILIKFLADSDSDVRENVARALGSFGPAADKAGPILASLLCSEYDRERRAAAGALFSIHVKETDTDELTKAAIGDTVTPALCSLGRQIPSDSKFSRRELLQFATTNQSLPFALFTAVILNVAQPGNSDSRLRLEQSLTNADPCIRISAAYSLVSGIATNSTMVIHYNGIASNAVLNGNVDARERIEQALTNADPCIRVTCAYSLASVTLNNPTASRSFQKALTASKCDIEWVARLALGRK